MVGHVILFPFMAQGHITPFIALTELLHRRWPELTITIINTPRNIQSIQSSFPDPIPTIRFRSLPFSPSDHGLPPNTESLAGLPFPQFLYLLIASESLRPQFTQLLHQIITEDGGRVPSCIISDNFLSWTVDIAEKLNIFHSTLITSGTYGTAIAFTLWLHMPKLPAIETQYLSLPDFPEINIHWSQLPRRLFLPDDNFASKYSSFLQRQTLLCFKSNAILLNTVKEFETAGLRMLEKLITGVPLFPIGPLLCQSSPPPSSSLSLSLSLSLSSSSSCVEWLDKHSPGTVLYISFGSQNSINASQMMELAAGLEASEKAFIWVIRPPFGVDVTGEFKLDQWLPEGFEERMREKKQGLLVHAWAPQVEILAHESTSAFLSHCGWNSVLESLSHGVPIIGWPLGAEQFYNSMFLEEVGVCVELGRGNREKMSGIKVERERVKKVVEMVMGGGEKGVEMKKKAMEISGMIRGALMEVDIDGGLGSSLHGLDEFCNLVFSKLD
ncbi:UDP-glucuronosyl/UDP-glucosyltransferase protein [Dioscorea alata]|uniref:UDP-glucuronosyl/UDP-glucosyltransferase protein n=1 Tax=Dioscorea alata TaxID=55571 RepID=A0ACB7UPY1_DIOAL|nr:UDP-glucuronosyl/UDP-glucosyltransferase protein [Dioscorea alata]